MPVFELVILIFIALEHSFFLVLEMFLWTTKIGMKIFSLSTDFAEQSKKMAANQGLYNGFLAAGIVLSIITSDSTFKYFFVSCAFVAGIIGAITVSKRIFIIQSVPAIVAFVVLILK